MGVRLTRRTDEIRHVIHTTDDALRWESPAEREAAGAWIELAAARIAPDGQPDVYEVRAMPASLSTWLYAHLGASDYGTDTTALVFAKFAIQESVMAIRPAGGERITDTRAILDDLEHRTPTQVYADLVKLINEMTRGGAAEARPFPGPGNQDGAGPDGGAVRPPV